MIFNPQEEIFPGVKQLYPNLFVLEIPLPNNPLRALCSYVLRGAPGERSLMIDTGFNEPEAFKFVLEALDYLKISRSDLDFLTTHLHSDHSGQLLTLKMPNSVCYASVTDGPLINQMTSDDYWQDFSKLFIQLGLQQDAIEFMDHPGYKYCPKAPIDFTLLQEGDTLSYAGYQLLVYNSPGHTPGHIVLFEPTHKLLFSGDHVLPRITPNISFWGFAYGNMLRTYLDQLEKVRALSPALTCAAHRGQIVDLSLRIDELKQHHEERLMEILNLVNHSNGRLNARYIASKMHWDLSIKNFEDFPKAQKWFATSEAMSHLIELEARGLIDMFEDENIVWFNKSAYSASIETNTRTPDSFSR